MLWDMSMLHIDCDSGAERFATELPGSELTSVVSVLGRSSLGTWTSLPWEDKRGDFGVSCADTPGCRITGLGKAQVAVIGYVMCRKPHEVVQGLLSQKLSF